MSKRDKYLKIFHYVLPADKLKKHTSYFFKKSYHMPVCAHAHTHMHTLREKKNPQMYEQQKCKRPMLKGKERIIDYYIPLYYQIQIISF